MSVVLVNVKKAAERLSISKSGVYNLMDSGQLAWVRIGSARRVRESDIDDLIRRNTHGGHTEIEPDPVEPETVSLPAARPAPNPNKPGRKPVKAGGRRRG